jgi:UDP-N-acetylglucosamine 2-epimerase
LSEEGLRDNTLVTGDMAIEWYNSRWLQLRTVPHNRMAAALVTLHRPGNMNASTFGALNDALNLSGLTAVWVRHPRNEGILDALIEKQRQIAPQVPSAIAAAVVKSSMLITDSGGLAREAHWLARPVIMRRSFGGWPELVEAGYVFPVRTDSTSEAQQAITWAKDWIFPGIDNSPLFNVAGRQEALKTALPAFLGLRR